MLVVVGSVCAGSTPVSEGVVTPLGGWTPGPFTLGCLDRGSIHPRVNGPSRL